MKAKNMMRLAALSLALGAVGNAEATLYANNATRTFSSLGSPDTTSYGQVFTAPSNELNDFTFFATSGSAGQLELVIARWDGSKAVGPALYTSPLFNYAGGAQTLGFANINTLLNSASTYIAYLTTAGLATPASNISVQGNDVGNNAGLGGGFAFKNSNGVDPLTLNTSWTYLGSLDFDMRFRANFSNVPEPASFPLMMLGFALLVWKARSNS